MPYNPFTQSWEEDSQQQEKDVMTPGVNAAVRTLQGGARRDAQRDPLAESMRVATQQKTQLGYARQAAEQLRDKFLATEGADLFQTDPLSGKPLQNPDKTFVPKLEAEIQDLRKRAGERVGMIRGALTPAVAGDLTAQAIEAQRRLEEVEPIYKAKRAKWDRINEQLQRIQAAYDENEMTLGSLAATSLQAQGVLAPMDAQAQPQAQPAGQATQQATNPESTQAEQAPQEAGIPPAEAVKLYRQIKEAEAVLQDPNTGQNLRKALGQKIGRLKDQLGSAYQAFTPEVQARVSGATKDPTFFSEFAKNAADQAASFASGTGSLVGMIGDIYGLVTGDMDNATSNFGKLVAEHWNAKKSDNLREREAKRQQEIAAAPDELGKAWAYVRNTVSDPILMANALLEQVPQFVPGGVTGAAARAAAARMLLKKAASGAAAVKAAQVAANRVGTGVAVGTGAAMQGADVGSDQFEELATALENMSEQDALKLPEIRTLVDKGAPLEEAKAALALSQARKTSLIAGAVSLVAQGLPNVVGLPTIEKALVGGAAKFNAGRVAGAAIGATVEAASEAAEEGGGLVEKNILARPVDPDREATKNLGETVGQAMVIAGVPGAIAGASGAENQTPPVAPPQNPAQPAQPGQPNPAAPAGGAAKPPTAAGASVPTPGAPAAGPSPVQTPPPAQPAQPAPEAEQGEEGPAPAQSKWTFKDSGGNEQSVEAGGLREAISKLPQGFVPDLKQTPRQEPIQAKQPAKEWEAFPPETQTLGIPRADMPQVKAEHRGALTNFLKARGIESTTEEVLPGTLKPTQAEFSPEKVQKARSFTEGDRAIIVSSDGHVVDGHHQWLARYQDKRDEPMKVIRLSAPIREALDAVKEFPSAKASAGATPTVAENAPVAPSLAGAAMSQMSDEEVEALAEYAELEAERRARGKSPGDVGVQSFVSKVGTGELASLKAELRKDPTAVANYARKLLGTRGKPISQPSPQGSGQKGVGASNQNPQAPEVPAGNPLPDGQKQTLPTESGQTPQVGGPKPVPVDPGTGKAPSIVRGKNKPAVFHETVIRAAKLKPEDRASKFVADFSKRMSRMNPKAFGEMEVYELTNEEWSRHPELGARTPDSAGAYDGATNTLYINTDKSAGEQIVNTIVHEAGHFAERFALGEDFTQREWEKLDIQQRIAAVEQYRGTKLSQEEVREFGAGFDNKRARAEWVAMQFARVVKGDTKGMSQGMRARLEKLLDLVRDILNKWIGNGKLTTPELDAKILDILGYTEGENPAPTAPPAPEEVIKGKDGIEIRIFKTAEGRFNVIPVDTTTNESFGYVRTGVKTIEEARRIANEMLTGKKEQAPATPAPAAPKPPESAPKPTPGISAEADKALDDAFDGLLGTPAAEIPQEAIPEDKIPAFIAAARALIKSGIRTPEAMAQVLETKYKGAVRKYSESLWDAFGMADKTLRGTHNWNAIYAQIDNPTKKNDNTADEGSNVSNPPRMDEGPAAGPAPGGDSGSGRSVGRDRNDSGSGVGDQGTPGEGGGSPARGERGNDGVSDAPTASDGKPGRGPTSSDGKGVSGNRPDSERIGGKDVYASEDLRIQPDDVIVPRGRKARINANVAAIRLLRELGDKAATPEQKRILARFSGWGDTFQVFGDIDLKYGNTAESVYLEEAAGRRVYSLYGEDQTRYENWKKDYGETFRELHPNLGGLLNEQEFQSAKESSLNAHYTSREVIGRIWSLVQRLGFKGGRAIEPSAGIGHFIGLAPDDVAQNTQWTGIELDAMTGALLKKLYPKQDIQVTGFEKSLRTANNAADLVISNFPFGDYPISDPSRPEIDGQSIHNYFLGRSIDAVKPGGLVVAITSRFTLDGTKARKLRESISNKANFVGAIRLPNSAFKDNAGTVVVTDVLVFQKKGGPVEAPSQRWAQSIPAKVDNDEVNLNEYFVANPGNVIGVPSMKGTMYGGKSEYTVDAPKGREVVEVFDEIVAKMPENITSAPEATQKMDRVLTQNEKPGSYILREGKIYQVGTTGEATIALEKAADVAKAKQLIAIRETLIEQIKIENDRDSTDQKIAENRKKLNDLYDSYTKKHGALNESTLIDDDPEWPLVAALEDEKTETGETKNGKKRRKTVYVKGAPLLRRFNFPIIEPTTAGNLDDALNVSMAYKGKVDTAYIGSLLSKTAEEAESEIIQGDKAFKNPETGVLEIPEVYLSGFVRLKLELARNAAREDQVFQRNVDALEKVQPAPTPIEKTQFRLGSNWIPSKVIRSFIAEVLGVEARVELARTDESTVWEIEVKSGESSSENTSRWAVNGEHGTGLTGVELVLDSLNLKLSKVTYTIEDASGNKKSVEDIKATAAARDMQNRLHAEFRRWALADPDISSELSKGYENTYGGIVVRKTSVPDIEHFPGASPLITLRPWQKRAARRAVQEAVLLSHSVGTGKTYTLITSVMEMVRLGTARKPMVVVQNSTIGQFARSWRTLYPNANILVAPSESKPGARERFVSQATTRTWDAIIVPISFFERLPNDPVRERGYVIEQLDLIEDAIRSAEGRNGNAEKPKTTLGKMLQKARKRAEARMDRIMKRIAEKQDSVINFEDIGVDALVVDEAHAFKRGDFFTKMDRIKGLDTNGSDRALSFYLKTQYIHTRTPDRNVILATGTPISNTLAEMWTMARYVKPNFLREFGVNTFDDFVGSFAIAEASIEETPTGGFKQVLRLAKYINGPAITTMWRTVADIYKMNRADLTDVPKVRGGGPRDVVIERSESLTKFVNFMRDWRKWWEDLEGKVRAEISWVPVVQFTLARKLSIDLRLVNPSLPDDPASKLNIVVDQVFETWKATKDITGVQIVFSNFYQSHDPTQQWLNEDLRIPNPHYGKPPFNAFHEMRNKLIERGVPPDEIAVFTDLTKPKIDAAADKISEGSIRIAFGSTETLGTGLNIQKFITDIIHIDPQLRPMDWEQRNGRGIRQGNTNPEVGIDAFGVKNTMDTTLYQIMLRKGKFIAQAETDDLAEFEDPSDENVMSFQQMTAAFSGNPLQAERFALENEERTLDSIASTETRRAREAQRELSELKKDRIKFPELIESVRAAAATVAAAFPENKITTVEYEGNTYTGKEAAEIVQNNTGSALDSLEDSFVTQAKADGLNLSYNQRSDLSSPWGATVDREVKLPMKVNGVAIKIWHRVRLTLKGADPKSRVVETARKDASFQTTDPAIIDYYYASEHPWRSYKTPISGTANSAVGITNAFARAKAQYDLLDKIQAEGEATMNRMQATLEEEASKGSTVANRLEEVRARLRDVVARMEAETPTTQQQPISIDSIVRDYPEFAYITKQTSFDGADEVLRKIEEDERRKNAKRFFFKKDGVFVSARSAKEVKVPGLAGVGMFVTKSKKGKDQVAVVYFIDSGKRVASGATPNEAIQNVAKYVEEQGKDKFLRARARLAYDSISPRIIASYDADSFEIGSTAPFVTVDGATESGVIRGFDVKTGFVTIQNTAGLEVLVPAQLVNPGKKSALLGTPSVFDVDPAAPNAQQWQDATDEQGDPTDVKRLREFEADINRERRATGAPLVRLTLRVPFERADLGRAEGAPGFKRALQGLSQAFGKRVIFYRAENGAGVVGATSDRNANTIMVDASAAQPLHVIIGHELSHNINAQRPDLFDQLSTAVEEFAPMPADYGKMKLNQGYPADKIAAEWIGDVLGERMDEPEFWREVARVSGQVGGKAKNVGMLRQLAAVMDAWFKRMGGRLRKLFAETSGYVRDLDALQTRVAEILATHTGQGPYPDNPGGLPPGGADADLATSGVDNGSDRIGGSQPGKADRRLKSGVTTKASGKPTGDADGRMAEPTNLTGDKWWLSPDGKFVPVDDHEPAAAKMLGKRYNPDDRVMDRHSETLRSKGWVRVTGEGVDTDTIEVTGAGHNAPTKLTKAQRAALEDQALFNGRPVYDANFDEPKILFGRDSSILGTPPVRGTPAQEEVIKKVTGTLEDNRTISEKVRDYLADLGSYIRFEIQQKVLDRFTSIKRYEKATFGTNDMDASVSPYKWARLTSNLAGVMEYLFRHGQIAYQGGSMVMKPGTKGLIDILRPITESGKLQLWEGYVAAFRANRLLAEGKEKNFGKYQDPVTGDWLWDQNLAQQEIDTLLELANDYPEFETVRQEYVAFQQSVLDVAEASGLIDPAKRALWERSDYVPFYRIVDTLDGRDSKGPRRRRGFSGQSAGIRKLKGGPQQVAILENIVRNIEQMVDASFKNIAMQRIADMSGTNSDLMVKIPYKSVPFKASFDETVDALEKAGVDTSALTRPEIEELVTFWRSRAPEGKDVVMVMHRGKPQYYRVKDAPLLRSILALGPDRHSWWMSMLMAPKRVLTSLVTLDPAFMAANTIRDSFSAWVISDTPIKPGWDSMRGFAKALKDDPVKLGIMAAGGGTGHYNNVREEEVRKAFLAMTREQRQGFLNSIIDTPAKAARLYKDLGRATENANRVAIAESATKRGASPAEAAFQALDIMDFGLRGDSKALAFFLDTVPFLNARIQGLYRLGRGLKNDPKRVATHGAIIMGATLALLGANWDDDRYWDLPEWDRDLYYHLWIGDRHVRIPKPFEVGQIFSTLPERMMQFMAKDGDSRILSRRLLSMIGDTFAMNPTPQIAKPLLERAMNRNWLTGARVISQGDEFRAPVEQYNAFTSATAREIAQSMPENAPEWLRSPKTLDFLIRGYFGSLGMYALDASDAIVRSAASYPEKPESKIGDYWLMRRFSPEGDLRDNKFVSEFYELNNDIAQISNRIRTLAERGDVVEANSLVRDNADLLAFAPQAKATEKAMSAIRRRENAIYEDDTQTPAQRREELAELKRQKNRLAKQTVNQAPRRPTPPLYNPFR